MNCEVSLQPGRQRLSLKKGSLERTGMGADGGGEGGEGAMKSLSSTLAR